MAQPQTPAQLQVREQLLKANKLIFVKAYDEAESVLERVAGDPNGRLDVLVHLRRIELAQMLGTLPDLRRSILENYTRINAALQKSQDVESNINSEMAEIFQMTMALADQHSGNVTPSEAMIRFQDLMRDQTAHPAIHYGLAFALEGLGNNDRAIWHYEQSIRMDPEWYPSYFALSQLHYQKGDEKRGDEYFFQFEQAAPYNVYGNFETHRKLYMESFDEDQYDKASEAVLSLSTWWRENRGKTPHEILAYEGFALGRIALAQGNRDEFNRRILDARQLIHEMMASKDTEENTLYFVAKTADEFNECALAFEVYRHVLKRNDCNPKLVQRIGGQFLTAGEPKMACDLFEDAYNALPDSTEIRFCLLVGRLKLAEVNVEEYLISRERLKQVMESQGDKVETLTLLHNLMAKFRDDPDVLGHLADVYLKMGHVEKATQYFDRMYQLDGRAKATAIKYAAFTMQYGDPDVAMEILDTVAVAKSGVNSEKPEIYWLRANYFARKMDFKASTAILHKAIALDPWNVSYLLQLCINLQEILRENDSRDGSEHSVNSDVASDDVTRDPALITLSSGGESSVNWDDFDRRTRLAEESHAYDLAYSRRKLRFLYSSGSGECLIDMIHTACRHNAEIATYELIRLLNTNYDSPSLYWALGLLFKELWQLETAGMWLEQALINPHLDEVTRRRTLLELADCYIWRNVNLKKAIEFAKLAIELGERANGRAITVLAHAYLKQGNIRQAQNYLDQVDRNKDIEATFLLGLLQYRNGARQNANQIWKPLIAVRSESLRFHNIKQEILRYYFEGSPYLKGDGSQNVS